MNIYVQMINKRKMAIESDFQGSFFSVLTPFLASTHAPKKGRDFESRRQKKDRGNLYALQNADNIKFILTDIMRYNHGKSNCRISGYLALNGTGIFSLIVAISRRFLRLFKASSSCWKI